VTELESVVRDAALSIQSGLSVDAVYAIEYTAPYTISMSIATN